MQNALIILKKIHTRGLSWFLARLLQEAERGVSFSGKLLKPFTGLLYCIFIAPANKLSTVFTNNQVTVNDTLYFFYDLSVAPITYDFAWALILAEQARKQAKLKKLQIIFVPGEHEGLREELPEYEKCVDSAMRYWRISEMLLPMCRLLSSCTGTTLCSTREEANLFCQRAGKNAFPRRYTTLFPIAPSTSHALDNTSSEIMTLRATAQAQRYIAQWIEAHANHRKLITISLRQSTYQPERNSNLTEWIAFAEQLDPAEYCVIFVPDTENALTRYYQPLKERYILFSEAAWNVNLRAALYQASYLNLGVNNGVMGLCWLNAECRYITFKMAPAEATQMAEEGVKSHGFKIGESLPFATAFQKWVWQDDNLDVIVREFKEMHHLS